MTEAFPLAWPTGRPRTPSYQQKRAAFKTTQDKAQRELLHEIKLLGGRNVIISTNMPIRRDGMPYAAKRIITDPGVAVYFDYKGRQKCFACDRWDDIKDNMQAINHTINALRGIARWGTGDMVEAAFTGFDALPPPSAASGRPWRAVLGFTEGNPSMATITARYRELAKEHHPDAGGDEKQMSELNTAYEAAKREYTEKGWS